MRKIKKRILSFIAAFSLAFSLAIYVPQNTACAESHLEAAIQWAIDIAEDDTHGYSQAHRWGPDYDCSSFVISALRAAGFETGNAEFTYTMKKELTKYGFTWIPWSSIGSESNLRRGDILLNEYQHTEIYLGNGWNVGAHSNKGHPATGDYSGKEISVSWYYNHPWHGVLRYTGEEPHSFGKWKTTVEATCTSNGQRERLCSICGKLEKTIIPADDHKYTETEISPTCTANGRRTTSCAVCGEEETVAIPSSGHRYVDTVIPPTCTMRGYTERTCRVCGDSFRYSIKSALDHLYEEIIINPATYEKEGEILYACVDCHAYYYDIIPMLSDDDDITSDDESCSDDESYSDDDSMPIAGDVNGDGRVNTRDVMMLSAYIKGLEPLADDRLLAADVDRNGKVDIDDMLKIAAYVRGISRLEQFSGT